MPRIHRPYEATCDCNAYAFPHRMFGGRCEGLKVVIDEFKNAHYEPNSHCTNCINSRSDGECDVVLGIETPKEAPYQGVVFTTLEIARFLCAKWNKES